MLLLRSLAAIPAALHPIKPPGASVFQDQQQTAAAAPPQIAAAPPQAPARQQPTEPTQSSTAHAQQPTEALQSRAAAPQQEQLPPTEPTQSSTADAQQPTEALQSRAAAPQQEQLLPTEPTQSSTADAQQPTEALQSSAPAPQQTAAPSQSTEQDAQQHAPRAPFAVLVEALQSGRITPDNLATFVASLTAPTPTPPPSPAAEVKIEPGAMSVVAASAEPVAAPEPKASSPAAPMPASMLAPGQVTEQRFNSSTHPNQWRKFERFCENNEHASELKKMYSLEAELLITVAVALYPGILTHESLHVCPAEEGRSDQIGGIREIREGELCLG